jgi:DinB family protein
MTGSPDPVTQAAAYQRMLLDLLGSDDPVSVQQSTVGRIEAVLNDAGPDLRRRPALREWSVLELLGHLVDAEIVMSGRYRWVLSHDQPPLLGYDQDLWVDRLRHNEDDVVELLPLLVALRAANIRLWQRSSAPDRSRVAIHSERGPESFDLMFRMLAGHDRFHVNQMQATLRQLRAAS